MLTRMTYDMDMELQTWMILFMGKSKILSEADPGFAWWGGGAPKVMCMHEVAYRVIGPGSRARIRALEALGVFNIMISHASRKTPKSIQVLGARAPVAPL